MYRRRVHTGKSINFSAAGFVGLTFFLAAWAGSTKAPAPNGPAVLKLSIIDETTGKPTPARVEVLDKDGHAYFAQDALLIGGD
jgi:hypothetical protein